MWLLSIDIQNCKFRTKVTKDTTKQTTNFRLNESNWRLMVVAIIVKLNCFV
uniref:Ubiquitin-activating enzyme n=1 Tax=Arundo donax TaxID=35708 RepID=A0A0A9CV39_ARUDO